MDGMRLGLASIIVGSLVFLFAWPGGSVAQDGVVTSADQTALRLTIYDRGSALIEETRRVRLPASGSIIWRQVPKTLVATSVQLEGPKGLQVLSERFRYDPLTHGRLLKAAKGGRVDLVVTSEETGEERRTEAVLLAAEGAPVFQIGQEIHLGHPGRVVLPRMPAGLALEPEIIWRLVGQAGEAPLTARYLAGGFRWHADYALRIDEATLKGTLSGAFTITNESGTDIRNASVQLVAGTIHRKGLPVAPMMKALHVRVERVEEAPVADLHRYTVEGPVTVADDRTVRFGFLQAEGIQLDRRYEVRGGWPAMRRSISGDERLPVAVIWLLTNTVEAGLGRPLPAGIVRLYVAQGERPLLLAGEVPIGHIPAGEREVKLETGRAFDLVARRRQTAFQRLSKEVTESAWRVTVENHKSADVTVRLVERVPAQAEVLTASHPPERTAADRLVFTLVAPAGRVVEVAYRVRVRLQGR